MLNLAILTSGLLLLLSGCASSFSNKTDTVADSAVAMEQTPSDSVPGNVEGINRITIPFDEITLRFEGGILSSVNDNTTQNERLDTAYIELEMGEDIGQVGVLVMQSTLQDLVVEQSMQTTMTINNEGPSCELDNWKHYVMPWVALKKGISGNYQLNGYSDKEYNLFPEVTVEEIKTAAKAHCGNDWIPVIDKINTLQDAYCDTVIDKVMIRVSGKKATGESVVKYVIIKMPTGC
jgi:hypothetical protein